MSFRRGKLTSLYGTDFFGFMVTVGGITDPSEIKRTYDDIEKILHQNEVEYKTYEERTPENTFKKYVIQT